MNNNLKQKIRRYLQIRWRAFKRRPLLFIRYALLIILFRFFGVIICLFLTVIPLPLNHFVQNLFNIQLSFNSLKDVLLSIKKIAAGFSNLLPSLNELLGMARQFFLNITSLNPLSILRSLPDDLYRFFTQFFSTLRQRLNDLRLFVKNLYPLKDSWQRFKQFIKKHMPIVRRVIKSLLELIFSVLFVKILFLLIIPLLGLSAVYVFGVNISLIILATLSLISSQLGALLGRSLNRIVLKSYAYIERNHSGDKDNVLIIIFYLTYAKFKIIILNINFYLCRFMETYLDKVKCLYQQCHLTFKMLWRK